MYRGRRKEGRVRVKDLSIYFVCMYVFICVHTSLCMHMEAGVQPWCCSSAASHLICGGRASNTALELTDEARLTDKLDPGIPPISVLCPSTGAPGVCYCAKVSTWVLVMECRSLCFPSKNLTEFCLHSLKVYLLIKRIAN